MRLARLLVEIVKFLPSRIPLLPVVVPDQDAQPTPALPSPPHALEVKGRLVLRQLPMPEAGRARLGLVQVAGTQKFRLSPVALFGARVVVVKLPCRHVLHLFVLFPDHAA